jgi:hypothetical protein
VEPELHVIKEVERGKRHALVLRGAADEEVPLTTVQPRKGVAGVVELRKLQFVGGREEGPVAGVSAVVPGPAAALVGLSQVALCGCDAVNGSVRLLVLASLLPLDAVYCRVEGSLLLTLLVNRLLEQGDLVLQGLQFR